MCCAAVGCQGRSAGDQTTALADLAVPLWLHCRHIEFHLTEVEMYRIIAMKDEGYRNAACENKVGRSAKTVGKWWRRYETEGEELKKEKLWVAHGRRHLQRMER